jgi:hypothetical protein
VTLVLVLNTGFTIGRFFRAWNLNVGLDSAAETTTLLFLNLPLQVVGLTVPRGLYTGACANVQAYIRNVSTFTYILKFSLQSHFILS